MVRVHLLILQFNNQQFEIINYDEIDQEMFFKCVEKKKGDENFGLNIFTCTHYFHYINPSLLSWLGISACSLFINKLKESSRSNILHT